jgi:hypothetical protein
VVSIRVRVALALALALTRDLVNATGAIGSVVRIVAPYVGGVLMDSALGVTAPAGAVAVFAALTFVLLKVVPLPIVDRVPGDADE